VATVTRAQIKYDVVNYWNAAFDETLERFVMPLVSTGIAGNKLSVVDTVLGRGTVGAADFNARQIEVMETTTGSPAIGEAAGVDSGGFDGTSTLTFSPAMSDEIQSGMDYMLYGAELSPERLNNEIDRVLRSTEAPFLWFPSLVQDSHMENTGSITTFYATLGTPSTAPEYVTTISQSEHEVLLGERALHVVSDATGEGASTAAFAVTERERLLISAFTRVISGSVLVRLYNNTASASIYAPDAVDEYDWTEVRYTQLVPDSCKLVRLDIESATTVSEFHIAPPVIVQSYNMRYYPMPSWFTHESQFQSAFYMPQGFASEDPESYQALSSRHYSSPRPRFLRRDRAIVPLWVQIIPTGGNPVGLVLKRKFEALSTNAATTTCDREYLKWRVLANLFRQQNDPRWRELARSATARARDMGYGGRGLQMRESDLVVA